MLKLKKAVRAILLILGAAFFIDGGCMAIYSNINLGTVLTLLLGLLLLFWGGFYDELGKKTKRGAGRVCKYVVMGGLAVMLCGCVFLVAFGSIDTADYDEDAVIVLGCGVVGDRPSALLALRLDAALEYAGKNPKAVIAVSGGRGFQEDVSEAEVMTEYLVERGVDADKIIQENRSASTSENYRFSKELLDAYFGGGEYRVVTVTNDFHIFRAKGIARHNGLETTTYYAPTMWYMYPSVCMRECLAALYFAVFGS